VPESRPVVTRWARLRSALDAGLARDETYCRIACDLLGAAGAGLTLVATGERPQVCVSDPVAAALEDLQFTLGEGPSVDANGAGLVVVAHDTAGPGDGARWPAFATAAAAAGIRGVYAVPLRVGAAPLGVLTLYTTSPGAPGGATYADALVLGALLTREVVRVQTAAGSAALARSLADAGGYRAQVHQASGMVSVQLGISVLDGLLRLRGHAFAADLPVDEVAAMVIARTMRFEE
jgi:hypothetical protein